MIREDMTKPTSGPTTGGSNLSTSPPLGSSTSPPKSGAWEVEDLSSGGSTSSSTGRGTRAVSPPPSAPPEPALSPTTRWSDDNGAARILHTPSPPPRSDDGVSFPPRQSTAGSPPSPMPAHHNKCTSDPPYQTNAGPRASPSPSPSPPAEPGPSSSSFSQAPSPSPPPALLLSVPLLRTVSAPPDSGTGAPPAELKGCGTLAPLLPVVATASSSSSSASTSPSTSPTTSPYLGTSVNPRRSLNAAFTLSPRADSDAEASEENNGAAPRVLLELDQLDPPVKQFYQLGSLEERRAFVTEGCVAAAKAMSTARILDHLLPALLTAFEADDYGESFDDCVPCIARALPQIIACMETRTTATLTHFMGLIMELCCSAEESVAKAVTAALKVIIEMVEDKVVLDLFLPFVLVMRVSFWSTPRVVAASLLGYLAMRPAVLQRSGLTVNDLFRYYAECSSDVSAMVRCAVVLSLHDWVRVAAVHRLKLAEMPLPLLKSIATDDLSDAVRYLLVEEVVTLAQIMGPRSTTKYLLGVFVGAALDPSWRVRFMAANRLGDMAALVLNADDLEVVIEKLSRDEEPETRAAVARQLNCLVKCCSADVAQRCCAPVALALSQDADPGVRRSVARHSHCLIFGDDDVVVAMCNALRALMQDSAFPVQEKAIESLGDLVLSLEESVRAAEQQAALGATDRNGSPVSSPLSRSSAAPRRPHRSTSLATPQRSSSGSRRSLHQNASRLANSSKNNGSNSSSTHAEPDVAFVKRRSDSIAHAFMAEVRILGESCNWRIRHAAVQAGKFFCRVLAPEQYRPLTSLIFISLHDPVSAVRSQAVHTLAAVANSYGGAWAAQTALELLHSDTLSPAHAVSFVWRMVLIRCLEVLLPVAAQLPPGDALRRLLLVDTLPLLHDYVEDRVPNVRLATAQALLSWRSWFDRSNQERVAYNTAIGTLQQDADVDVQAASQNVPFFPSDLGMVSGSEGDATAP